MNLVIKNLFVIFLSLSFSFSVFADKAELDYKGKAGIWFDEDSATLMLNDLSEFKILKNEKIPQLERKIELEKLNIENLKLNLKITEEIGDKWKKAFNDSEELRKEEVKYLRTELDKKERWYKKPAFAFIGGIIAGGLLAVGLSFGLSEALK